MFSFLKRGSLSKGLPPIVKKSDGHIDILDGLRGLAILLVFWFHLWQMTWFNAAFKLPAWGILGSFAGQQISLDFISWFGFIGVELFFFVSGFALFYPYAQGIWSGKRHQSLFEYTGKRFFKIVPSYFLALLGLGLFAFLGQYLFGDSGGLKDGDIWKNIWTHLTFTHNLWPETESGFTGVLWSLAVEVQFYLFFPFLAWLIRKGVIPALLTFAGIIGIAFGYRAMVLPNCIATGNFFPLHQLPSFIDLFAYGMFAAWLFVLLKTKVKKIEALKVFFTIAAVLSMIGFFIALNEGYIIRYAKNAVQLWQLQYRPIIGVLLIVVTIGSAFAFKAWRKILANPILLFLSTISYNLYIYHQFISRELLVRKIGFPAELDLQKISNPADEIWQWVFVLIAVATSIITATIITHFFELPILNAGKGWLRRTSEKMRLKKEPPPVSVEAEVEPEVGSEVEPEVTTITEDKGIDVDENNKQ